MKKESKFYQRIRKEFKKDFLLFRIEWNIGGTLGLPDLFIVRKKEKAKVILIELKTWASNGNITFRKYQIAFHKIVSKYLENSFILVLHYKNNNTINPSKQSIPKLYSSKDIYKLIKNQEPIAKATGYKNILKWFINKS
jgi:hypothetical protein